MWLQQAEKSELQCMKEYILLVAQFDKQIENTTKNVASGLIKEINIDSMVD